jgi:uncharacterized membrane protein
MNGWYGVLKVVHVLAVVVWIGGATALAMIVARLARTRDRAALASLLAASMRYGQMVAGPSSGLVLLTGIAMVIVGKLGFQSLWISWGFAGILVHFIFGATILRTRAMALAQAVSATPADEARIDAAAARLRVANAIYLLVMTSVIVVMVLKPTR